MREEYCFSENHETFRNFRDTLRYVGTRENINEFEFFQGIYQEPQSGNSDENFANKPLNIQI